MDEETKLYVDMLKGLSLAALITTLFRDGPFGVRFASLFFGVALFVAALWLVRRSK